MMADIKIRFTSGGVGAVRKDALTYVRTLAEAAAVVTDRAAIAGQRKIQSDMQGARLGRFRRVVKATSDRKKGIRPIASTEMRWRAGSAVFRRTENSPRAAGAWEAYTKGPVIVPKRGRWLAFPTDNVPKRAGRRKMTPALYNASGFASKIGPLVFIPGANPGVALLIVKNVTAPSGNKRGVAKKRGARGGLGGRAAREFLVMFILIRRTKRDVRFRPVEIVRAEASRIPKDMDTYVRSKLARRGAQVVSGAQIPSGVI